jgi:CLIP-associating protein 1/2
MKAAIESSGGLDLIEKSLKKALADQNAGLRDSARAVFWLFDGIWMDRGEVLLNGLDPTARKQLEKVAPSGRSAMSSGNGSQVETKKTSIAAAIAASRAKAKQIAAAPPTLRHAATAHASTMAMATSTKRPASPGSPPSSSRIAPVTSPTSAAKRQSGLFQRSATSSAVMNTGPKSPGGVTTRSNPSLSPPSSPSLTGHRKQITDVRSGPVVASPTSSNVPLRSPSNNQKRLSTSLSARSLSPPAPTNRASQVKRASGVFSSPKGMGLSPSPAVNDTLTLSPHPSDDESLMRVRAPNSEADSDDSIQIASFSDAYTSTPPGRVVVASTLTRSTNPITVPGPVVEDALRARAEQAESAAERLLEELVEPDETVQTIHIPPSLMPSTSASNTKPNGTARRTSHSNGADTSTLSNRRAAVPSTPANNRAALLKQAAAYQDSPPYKSGQSLISKLQDNRNESSWWLKRVSCMYTFYLIF